MREDDYSIFWGTILFLFCVYCVTKLWNKCLIITDGLSEMALQKTIILSECNEKRMSCKWIGYPALSAMTYFVLYNADLNHSLD